MLLNFSPAISDLSTNNIAGTLLHWNWFGAYSACDRYIGCVCMPWCVGKLIMKCFRKRTSASFKWNIIVYKGDFSPSRYISIYYSSSSPLFHHFPVLFIFFIFPPSSSSLFIFSSSFSSSSSSSTFFFWTLLVADFSNIPFEKWTILLTLQYCCCYCCFVSCQPSRELHLFCCRSVKLFPHPL